MSVDGRFGIDMAWGDDIAPRSGGNDSEPGPKSHISNQPLCANAGAHRFRRTVTGITRSYSLTPRRSRCMELATTLNEYWLVEVLMPRQFLRLSAPRSQCTKGQEFTFGTPQ